MPVYAELLLHTVRQVREGELVGEQAVWRKNIVRCPDLSGKWCGKENEKVFCFPPGQK